MKSIKSCRCLLRKSLRCFFRLPLFLAEDSFIHRKPLFRKYILNIGADVCVECRVPALAINLVLLAVIDSDTVLHECTCVTRGVNKSITCPYILFFVLMFVIL